LVLINGRESASFSLVNRFMERVKFSLACMVCISFILCGCAGDEFDFCSNPIGTTTKQAYHNNLICFQEEYNGCIRIEFNPSDYAFQCVLVTGGGDVYGSLVDVGAVDCVGAVNKPATGYSYRVTMKAGHGYAMKMTDGTYGRLWINSITGSGSSLTVSMMWQFPF
jgi:hypothetical protein